MKQYTFELVAGIHAVSDGVYLEAAKPGNPATTLKTDMRLDEIHGEKFKLVSEEDVPDPAPETGKKEKK